MLRSAVRLDADEACVAFDRVWLLGKRHVEAPIRLVDSVSQSNRVVVARSRPPDNLVGECESAVENVAFDGMILGVEPNIDLLNHSGVVVFP